MSYLPPGSFNPAVTSSSAGNDVPVPPLFSRQLNIVHSMYLQIKSSEMSPAPLN